MRTTKSPGRRGTKKPLIGVTMGDPAGIGPELCLRLLKKRQVLDECIPVVFGDRDILAHVARQIGLKPPRRVITLADWEESGSTEEPVVVDCGELQGQSVRPGEVQKSCGKAAYTYIEAAVRAAISGRTQAVATAPIHKEAFHMAGISYPGHTELLAALTGSQRVCMMMASERIVVSLVTAHRSLREVAREITPERVFHVIDLTAAALRRLGTKKPCIGVCGLNPHAGEHGILGAEERTGVLPAIARAREKGIEVEGPIPADTAFLPRKLQLFDAYVAMYHDQGLIPFKMLAFETGVNITLGLPIVRTSVDHGTAFDIAWQGVASPESLIQSVLWAKKLAWRR